jgi:hypothetical protein
MASGECGYGPGQAAPARAAANIGEHTLAQQAVINVGQVAPTPNEHPSTRHRGP